MSNVVSAVLAVFLQVGEWISEAVTSLTPMFWTGEALTFIGTLSICGLAFAVSFLIIGIIQSFLRFR